MEQIKDLVIETVSMMANERKTTTMDIAVHYDKQVHDEIENVIDERGLSLDMDMSEIMGQVAEELRDQSNWSE